MGSKFTNKERLFYYLTSLDQSVFGAKVTTLLSDIDDATKFPANLEDAKR